MLLARLCAAWLVGVAVADVLWPPIGPPPPGSGPAVAAGIALAAAAALAAALRRGSRRPCAAVSLALVAFLAAGRVWLSRPRFDAGHVAARRDRGMVALEGVIDDEPERRDGGVHYRLAVDRALSVAGDPFDGPGGSDAASGDSTAVAHGRVLVQAPRYPVLAYGDRVRVRGELITPPRLPGFDYRAYLARDGVHALVRRARIERLDGPRGGWAARRALLWLKARAKTALDGALPEPEAALATGILLGDDDGLPRSVADAFKRTNTTHVIAISGSNIALLVAALHVLTRRRRRATASIVTLAVVAAYTVLVGADPAVVRAAIMGGLSVLALASGRRAEAVTALGVAGAAMTAWRPAVIGDLGFQLSFAATAGLVAFAAGRDRPAGPRAERRTAGAARAFLDDAVRVTLAAQLATWPLVAWHTGQVGAVGLGANALIVPAQPAVMAGGAATIAAGLVAAPLGRAVGMLAWLPLAWTIRVVEACAALPGASLAWRPPLWAIAAYYGALAVAAAPSGASALAALVRRGRSAVRAGTARLAAAVRGSALVRRRASRLAAAAAAAALAWTAALAQPDGRLHVIALDVGQGDALLVVSPNGRRMLVDGGPSPSAVLDGLGRRFAPWDRRLDVVVLTHPDADHVAGLPGVLRRYRVRDVVDPGAPHDTPDDRAWMAAVAAEGATVHRAARGLRIRLDTAAGTEVEVLWPPVGDIRRALGGRAPTVNDHSVVLAIRQGRCRFLLTGDIEDRVEAALLRDGADVAADVLKVAHHGSATSTTPPFLAAVAPRLAVISVGADNRFGHPDDGVVARLGATAVRRTDRDGAVDVSSDGDGVWVR